MPCIWRTMSTIEMSCSGFLDRVDAPKVINVTYNDVAMRLDSNQNGEHL